MALETKAILSILARLAVKAKSTKEIYNAIRDMANVEGVILNSYEERKEQVEQEDA